MNNQQKEAIHRLRKAGEGYRDIAKKLDVSANTIKSFCRRNNLGGMAIPKAKPLKEGFCRQCGAPLLQTAGKKQKKYCSDQCRMAWWNAHPEKVTRKAIYHLTCKCCGKSFSSYGYKNRIYCCFACYIADRYGKFGSA